MSLIYQEIYSTVILPLPLIQEGQLSVSGESMHQVLVNRLERLSLHKNSMVRLTDRRYMTEILLLRRKTPTQTRIYMSPPSSLFHHSVMRH